MSAALHGSVLLLLLLLPVGAATPAKPRLVLTTFDVPGQNLPKPAPHRAPQPRKIVPPPLTPIVAPPPAIELPTLSPVVVAMVEQADAQAQSGGCDLTAPVQAALRTSTEVQEALASIPEERRSVANAIAVWNQTWVEPDELLTKPALDTIRATIATTIASASEECRKQPQGGPRLVYLPDHDRTTVLALGSAQWTWQEVADSAQPNPASNPMPEGVALAAGPLTSLYSFFTPVSASR
ncbi:MAG: hypothetical protein ABIT04_07115 [Novosphingobium sp.]